jgi:hypothetical protein
MRSLPLATPSAEAVGQARCTALSSPPKSSRPAEPTDTEVSAGRPFLISTEVVMFLRPCHAVLRVPPVGRSLQVALASIVRAEALVMSAGDCESLSAPRFACRSEELRAIAAPASSWWPKPPTVRSDCPRSRRRDRSDLLRRADLGSVLPFARPEVAPRPRCGPTKVRRRPCRCPLGPRQIWRPTIASNLRWSRVARLRCISVFRDSTGRNQLSARF